MTANGVDALISGTKASLTQANPGVNGENVGRERPLIDM